MMKRFLKESNVDGFEFVLLPEWDRENPPLTPTSAPFECEKHSVEEVSEVLRNESFPILSVHAIEMLETSFVLKNLKRLPKEQDL